MQDPRSETLPLAGQLALVTGGARRIGREVSQALVEAGADLVIHYNSSQSEAKLLADELSGERKVAVVQADLRRPEEAEALIGRASEITGRPLTLLVNSASTFEETKLDTITYDDLDRSMRLSAWAPFAILRSFAAQAEQGAVVNLLDARYVDYDWLHVGYILAKKTLAELTRMAAIEYAPNIRVNAVAPGAVLPPAGRSEEYIERLKTTMPLQRLGKPQDVAEAVVYLLTAPYVTGQVIFVDGGRHLGRTTNG